MAETPWFAERLYVDLLPHGYAQHLAMSQVICRERTPFQEVMIFENPRFGRVLALDGIIQTTVADEFIYHEMLVHVPLVAHGRARRVLIIGGGDGGALRQVLRHPVERVTLVEIDRTVVDLCRAHLPSVSNGAFDDPRVDLVIADGVHYLANTTATFDVVIVDGPDPVGPGEALFTEAFYRLAHACLLPGGVFVAQDGSPFFAPAEVTETNRRLKSMFVDATIYLCAVPSYVAAPLAIAYASDNGALKRLPLSELQARCRAIGLVGRYYTPDIHRAAFTLPPMVAELLARA